MGLISACSAGHGDHEAATTASQSVSSAVPEKAAAAEASGFVSQIKDMSFSAATALPKAPASAASQADCGGFALSPQSSAARALAAAGWGVTGEGRIGAYQIVSFAGGFEPATSGTCEVSKGHLAVYQGGRLVALAAMRAGAKADIGHIAGFGKVGLRIWDGDVVPMPLADLRLTDQGLVIGTLAAEEQTCGGAVPRIDHLPVTRARARLIAAGWSPINHGGPGHRSDSREADLARKGVIEVESCSGTGFGFCSYGYKRGAAVLSVTTFGDGEDPIVSDDAVRCGR